MAGTVLKLGWTNPLMGAFGDHPVLGAALDLNDGVTFVLAGPDALELEAPVRTLVTTGNIRTQGERATRGIYRHNRRLVARLLLGPMASYGDLVANVRALAQWLSAPPTQPVALQYQPPGASAPVYLDVVGAAHSIPSDEAQWQRLQLEGIEIVLLVRPGLRGDRVTLSNLVTNPGFEAPSGPGVAVFTDAFTNLNAYTTVLGSAPTHVASGMQLAANSRVTFGSPSWGAINLWQIRFIMNTGLTAYFMLHYTDGNNYLAAFVNGATLQLIQTVGGVQHVLANPACVLSAGTAYWLRATQFPSVPGDPPYVQAQIFADSGGSVGAQVGSTAAGSTFDAVTALAGVMAIQATSATMIVGGAFAGVHSVSLFGPGGWLFTPLSGTATGVCSGAWEQNGANTYPGGPVNSVGAARIDLPPAGTVVAWWTPYQGGAPAGTQAMAVVAAGNVLAGACYVRGSGLSASSTVYLICDEYDASGSFLRQTTLQSVAGNTINSGGSWTRLAGSVATGASCAYVSLQVQINDTTTGSAGGTLWIDNVQCWNATTTGVTLASGMPYCELRFTQSPAQLVVSGLLGDLPSPAYLACGTYLASWATGSTLSLALGRRGTLSGGAQLVGTPNGFYGTAFTPQAAAALDAASYGGYYAQATVTSAGWNPRAFSPHPADAPGTYHLFERHLTKQSAGNLANVQVRVVAQQLSDAWFGNPNGTDQLGAYTGAWTAPFTSSNAWTLVDAGQVTIPPLGAGALTDLTQTYVTPRPQWADSTGGGAIEQAGWQMLLPVDGSLLVGVLNNPSNAPFGVTGQWLWSYFDALSVASGGAAGWTYSLETTALPNPAHAGGGPGTQTTGAININSGADPYLTLDPTQQLAGNGGVNQLVGYIADGAATVLPLAAELQYAPLYLWPR